MRTITSAQAQKNFGSLVDSATTGESIRVTRYGRPGVYVIAENDLSRDMIRDLASRRLISRLHAMTPSPGAQGLDQTDINQIIDDCFA